MCRVLFSIGILLWSPLIFAEDNRLTFVDDIQPMMQSRCAFCHTGYSLNDWRDYDEIVAKASRVRYRVYERQDMPVNNMTNMTPEERELLALWIDEGTIYE